MEVACMGWRPFPIVGLGHVADSCRDRVATSVHGGRPLTTVVELPSPYWNSPGFFEGGEQYPPSYTSTAAHCRRGVITRQRDTLPVGKSVR